MFMAENVRKRTFGLHSGDQVSEDDLRTCYGDALKKVHLWAYDERNLLIGWIMKRSKLTASMFWAFLKTGF